MLEGEWIGPVYAFDRKVVARSDWFYVLRTLFLLVMLAGLVLMRWSVGDVSHLGLVAQQAETGGAFYGLIVTIGLLGAALIGPASAASRICLERSRGNFDLCLVSGLGPARIVFGKVLSRLWPVLAMMASTLPIVAVASLLGGIDPQNLLGAMLVCTALAVLSCTLATSLAFRTNKPHEALLGTYLWLVLFVVFIPFLIGIAFEVFNLRALRPLMVIFELNPIWSAVGETDGPASGLFTTAWELRAGSIVSMLGLSLALALWSTWRLRVHLLLGRFGARKGRSRRERPLRADRAVLDQAMLDADPVAWRERRRRRGGSMRWIWRGYAGMSVTLASVAALGLLRDNGLEDLAVMAAWFQIVVGLLLLATVAPTAMADERSQGSLDVLMTTPLTSREIVMGKWRTHDRLVLRLILLPTLLTILLVLLHRFGERANRPVSSPLPPVAPPSLGLAVEKPGVVLGAGAASLFDPEYVLGLKPWPEISPGSSEGVVFGAGVGFADGSLSTLSEPSIQPQVAARTAIAGPAYPSQLPLIPPGATMPIATNLAMIGPPSDTKETSPFLFGAGVVLVDPHWLEITNARFLRTDDGTVSHLDPSTPITTTFVTRYVVDPPPIWVCLLAPVFMAIYVGSLAILFVSIGTALAVYDRKAGRAVVVSVATYVSLALISVMPALLLSDGRQNLLQAFLIPLSPIVYPFTLMGMIGNGSTPDKLQWGGLVLATLSVAGASAGISTFLLRAAVRRLDSERGARRTPASARARTSKARLAPT